MQAPSYHDWITQSRSIGSALLVFYFLDRSIAHLANDLTDATFETGVLVMVLDAIVFVVLGGLSIYVAIKIWNRPG